MNTLPRHTTFSSDAKQLAIQAGENARDSIAALSERVVGVSVVIDPYIATGSTATLVNVIASDTRPIGCLLIGAEASGAATAPLFAAGASNFVFEPSTRTVRAFEPSGLTSGTRYKLTYLLVR